MTRAATSRAARRRAVAPRVPRRVSGPARPAVRRAPPPARLPRLLAAARALPDARVVDRLVRGRAWIVLVGGLLMGLVAMQVSMLRLNASINRAVAQGSNLQRRNGELRAAMSRLSSQRRVQDGGARLGMVVPEADRMHFLALTPGDAREAANALRAGAFDRSAAPPSVAPAQPSVVATQPSAAAEPTAAAPSQPQG